MRSSGSTSAPTSRNWRNFDEHHGHTRTSRAFDGPYFRMTEVMFDTTDDIRAALETDIGERILTGARALEEKYGVRLDVMIVADPA